MRKGRKKWEEGEEKERNPERGGGVGREAMMHGRSPATQPSAPSPPKPASLARPSGDAGLPGTAALGLTALPATPARRTQRPNAQSSPPEPSHPSPPLPGPRWPPTPAPTSPRAPITSLREKASERTEMGKIKGGGGGRPRKNYIHIIQLYVIYIYLNKVLVGPGGAAGEETRGRHLGRSTLLQIPRAAWGWAIVHKRKFGGSAAVCQGRGRDPSVT